ncbi:flagellar hook-associated protein 3 [Aurantiacibacter xanthus]|uniref:Flagellar hook-associated protein 3 n=1 Tax=Aurantiacibacter xanthus TaxID=1784712 RepID=A0A3A1P1J1_9SPHN|nr:flagellar hook-associated protein FlgL [Aurantiacibacter xanthus]RIV81342.1 flagellar hook-associated protein 3 [Aurantiacibacter xanthus]
MVTVSTSAFYERSNQQIGSLRKQAENLQQQVGSRERLSRSSEDPLAAAKLRSLARRERLSEIDQRNSDRAKTSLSLADSSLSSVTSSIIRARDLALKAASTTLTDDNRKAIAAEIEAIRGNLIALGNTPDGEGVSLFGGAVSGPAYVESGGVVSYVGGANAQVTELGEGQTVERSITGPDIFSFNGPSGATDIFAVLGAFSAALNAGGTAAAAAADDAVAALDPALQKATTAQTVIGTRMAWVETMDERRIASDEMIAQDRETVGGADFATTYTRLQEMMTVLEASQASFIKLSSLSLFDQLR